MATLDWKAVGERLKNLREGWELSQQEVAEKLGLGHKVSVSKIEKGIQKPSVEQLRTFAQLYRVSTDQILFGAEAGEPWAKLFQFVFFTQLDQKKRGYLRAFEEILLGADEATLADVQRMLDLVQRARGAPKRRAGSRH